MKALGYVRAKSVAETCALLAEHGPAAAVLAGGTDLLIGLRRSAQRLQVLIDISPLHELEGIAEQDGSISMGPLTTHAGLLRSHALLGAAPLLLAAAGTVGSPQIRARGTVGGNIMNAATCADTVPPLIALGATVTLQSHQGKRNLPLMDLFLKPYRTQARPDELLTQIRFPKLPAGARSAFLKLGRRNALAISRLSVASILEMGTDGRIVDARLVPGAAFPVWKRLTAAEQLLLGEKPSAKLFAAAGEKVSAEMIRETGRRWSTAYKEPVLAVLVRRALQACVAPGASVIAEPVTRSPRPSPPKEAWLESRVSRTAEALNLGAGVVPDVTAVRTTINGRVHTLRVQAKQTLLELLRDELGFSGTKCGCEIGECGACTVLLDGEPVNSCLVLAAQIHGREVLTVEGLAQNGKLHPLQEAFLDHDAVQCGFCTPGMLMSAKALLDWNPRATEAEIRRGISGNLCRCTGYQPIVEAIQALQGRTLAPAAPRV